MYRVNVITEYDGKLTILNVGWQKKILDLDSYVRIMRHALWQVKSVSGKRYILVSINKLFLNF